MNVSNKIYKNKRLYINIIQTHSIGAVTSLSFLLGAFTVIRTEVWELAFAGDATNFSCFVFTELAREQMLRIKKVGRSSAVAETTAACAKAIVLLQCKRIYKVEFRK